MLINDLIILKRVLGKTKIGNLPSDSLRKYLKLMSVLNTYNNTFNEKRKNYAQEAANTLGFDFNNITPEQDRQIVGLIAPLMDEYVFSDVDVNTKILSWEEIEKYILNNEVNSDLNIDEKTIIAERLCFEEL